MVSTRFGFSGLRKKGNMSSSSSHQRGTTFDLIVVEPIVTTLIAILPSCPLVLYVDPAPVSAKFEISTTPNIAEQAFQKDESSSLGVLSPPSAPVCSVSKVALPSSLQIPPPSVQETPSKKPSPSQPK